METMGFLQLPQFKVKKRHAGTFYKLQMLSRGSTSFYSVTLGKFYPHHISHVNFILFMFIPTTLVYASFGSHWN